MRDTMQGVESLLPWATERTAGRQWMVRGAYANRLNYDRLRCDYKKLINCCELLQ